jgi:hypothetical protein
MYFICITSYIYILGDTFASKGSWDAALLAASLVCYAVDQVAVKKFKNAFCAVRPPGCVFIACTNDYFANIDHCYCRHHAGIKGRTVEATSQARIQVIN